MARSQSADIDNGPLTPKPEGNPAGTETAATPVTVLRFRAPDHVSAITLSTGRELRVEESMLTVPADLSDDEQRQIGRAGCTPV